MQSTKYKRLKCASNVFNNSKVHQTKILCFSLVNYYFLFIYTIKTLMILQYFTVWEQNVAVTIR